MALAQAHPFSLHKVTGTLLTAFLLLTAQPLWAHGMAAQDSSFLQNLDHAHWPLLAYLGAKHMFTGYDHLLFLLGVVFFLKHGRDVVIFATLFALGHSITLLTGTLAHVGINPYLVDALIGVSVAYKALDNLMDLEHRRLPVNVRWAVFLFGLIHGLGLSAKLQDLQLSSNGLLENILAFNIGVELGQIAALSLIFLCLTLWRQSRTFYQAAYASNLGLMLMGFLLTGYQLAGYFL